MRERFGWGLRLVLYGLPLLLVLLPVLIVTIALILTPALTAAIEIVFPKLKSVEELYGRG